MSGIVVYSAQTSGFEPGFAYRNPKYFQKPLGDPETVIVVGNWPAVKAAYEAAGAKVQVVAPGTPLRTPGKIDPPSQSQSGAPTDPLDHDGNGKKGGSKAPDGDKDELAALRAEYAEKLGKKPFNGWDAAKLREKIAEATAA